MKSSAKKDTLARYHRLLGMFLALILLVMAVLQLFTFEDFPAQLSSLWETSNGWGEKLLAAALVTTEVFALPALIGMNVSMTILRVSRFCLATTATMWLLIALWQQGVHTSAVTSIFGATLVVESIVTLFAASVLAVGIFWWLWFWKRSPLR